MMIKKLQFFEWLNIAMAVLFFGFTLVLNPSVYLSIIFISSGIAFLSTIFVNIKVRAVIATLTILTNIVMCYLIVNA